MKSDARIEGRLAAGTGGKPVLVRLVRLEVTRWWVPQSPSEIARLEEDPSLIWIGDGFAYVDDRPDCP